MVEVVYNHVVDDYLSFDCNSDGWHLKLILKDHIDNIQVSRNVGNHASLCPCHRRVQLQVCAVDIIQPKQI